MRWLVCSIVSLSLVLVAAGESLNSGDACKTPSGTAGICEPVKNCSYVMKILQSSDFSHYDTEYLESLKCGEKVVPNRKKPISLLCCPKFDNVPKCGEQNIRDRIYFGKESNRGEHPWAALLFYNVGRNRVVPNCGGALVTQRYVITAAHCIVDKPKWKLLYVRFNEFNTSSPDNCTTLEDSDEVICRADYETSKIFRLRMKRSPSPVGEKQNSVNIPSDVQKHVDLPGLDNEHCNSVYAVANVTLTDKQLCIGGLNGSDSCRGDSGGPLMRQVIGDWFLVGVVSFGARICGAYNLPGVYTNIVKYLDWMETVMFVEQYL
ncbi:CLIP domain-containing serine protease B15-like isoform X2 [Anopheles moucheti]|uniref:CLIP domain-containing serine protease B15-like isoform X2 n=1 Tax=Anopheles moucheti TaxID=186751 RepID=UPI0022F00308|nr:CLIP domain-containing serine protease B15-like isoform X2 [Anopheles moucheti]